MVSLCDRVVTEPDTQQQNRTIKEEIYYYFNAKYSRVDFEEKAIGKPASMVQDLAAELSVLAFYNKYIELVHDERTGQFITNVKHLRGSAMRILRSNPDEPAVMLLKAFSLFILGDFSLTLLTEAKQELVNGLFKWYESRPDDPNLNVPAFIERVKSDLRLHIANYDINHIFADVEDIYYARYYAEWTGKFNQSFLETIN
jgi:hypothetical protein